jgi:Tc toxin complex TcA C-terminal TcB-binding domain
VGRHLRDPRSGLEAAPVGTWRTEETNQGLTLGPDYFKVTSAAPPLPPWRATVQARNKWIATLQARLDQVQATTQAFQAAVSNAEAATLPLLRDALVKAVSTAARARALYIDALDILDSPDMQTPHDTGDPAVAFGFAPNPEPQALHRHAELNLFKIRNGRNAAGMQRQVASYAVGDKAIQGSGGSDGSSLQPTPYHYTMLIDRAKQLVTLAQQMEGAYLAALEKRDAETYNLIKARGDLGVALATVQLQDARVSEASDGVSLATLQQSRAQVQQDTYKQWIDDGPIQAENALLQSYKDANLWRNLVAGADAAATVAHAITTASSGGLLGSGVGLAGVGVGITGAVAATHAFLQIAANNAEARVQAHSFEASYERREDEWKLQYNLAQKDVAISGQQIALAQDHLLVASQEQVISQMQANNAQAMVDFLANKFTSAELYEWMSGVLGRVYSYFLPQAIAIARLAQNQLAFERQEKPLSLIQADYWQAPTEGGMPGSAATNAPDRRGLTGSARLLQDIYQLDQYAFETNKRKLQLSKTVSLAQLAPIEFQNFRQTGVLNFAMPLALFDRDFPGHYLRLIRRVRTSVVALVPPNQGIRAQLSTTGLSRVVVGGDVFQEVLVRRDPEPVALSSPLNATGLFELDVQADMLLPFEGMGVDTAWELQMPKAANPFDYSTIADVLITIEYTALHSFDYRQQVIQRLERSISADRSFSLRQQFPDLWYDLHNPSQSATPMMISFQTLREDFPPNVESLSIAQVVLYFVRAKANFEVTVTSLQFRAPDGSGPYGGAATSIDGIISTRRGNGQNWTTMIQSGKAPVGTWSLMLPNTPDMMGHFVNDEITDILLIITYNGLTQAWPM